MLSIQPGQQANQAILAFQTKHREAWSKFLYSELGQAFMAAYFSTKPPAAPSVHPHLDSFALGRIAEYDDKVALIMRDLLTVPKPQGEVPQDYPIDTETGKDVSVADSDKSGAD